MAKEKKRREKKNPHPPPTHTQTAKKRHRKEGEISRATDSIENEIEQKKWEYVGVQDRTANPLYQSISSSS